MNGAGRDSTSPDHLFVTGASSAFSDTSLNTPSQFTSSGLCLCLVLLGQGHLASKWTRRGSSSGVNSKADVDPRLSEGTETMH